MGTAPPLLLVPTSPTATPPPATTVPILSEPSTLPRGRLRLMLRLRLIPTTDTATPPLATLDSATAVATTEDSAMATAVVTDTTVESKKSKDQHNAGAQLYPELASVSALSYLTAGYYFGNKKNQNLNKYAVPVRFAFPGLINSSNFTLTLAVY